MRKPLYAANWKMHKTRVETWNFFEEFLPRVGHRDDAEIIIAPPFTSIPAAVEAAEGAVGIAAQNMHFEAKGAFTGEVSAGMLLDLGCSSVIVGHSERRHIFGESDEMVNKKIAAALAAALRPIFCVGEKIEQREAGYTEEVLYNQVTAGLKGFATERLGALVVAYEPVWAIGTGLTATPEQAQEAHLFIRGLLSKQYGNGFAAGVRILYGGSVKPSNIAELMARPDVDGALVGGASLDPESFAAIVNQG